MTNSNDTDIAIQTKKKIDLKLPPKYKVILKNDNFTTVEFVIFILKSIFNKNDEDAMRITFTIHEKGSEVVGIYTKEIAITKVALCMATAKSYEFPLNCICEPIED